MKSRREKGEGREVGEWKRRLKEGKKEEEKGEIMGRRGKREREKNEGKEEREERRERVELRMGKERGEVRKRKWKILKD